MYATNFLRKSIAETNIGYTRIAESDNDFIPLLGNININFLPLFSRILASMNSIFKNIGQYGRFDGAAKYIDPREE